MKTIYTISLLIFLSLPCLGQVILDPPTKEPESSGLKKFLGINTHFPMRGAVGLELSTSGVGVGGPIRLEYGVNYVLTSWHQLQDTPSNEKVKEKGAFQLGTSLTFDRVPIINSDEKDWRMNVGLLYKNIHVERNTFGWNIRLKNSFVLAKLDGEGNIFSNMYGTAEVGVSFLSIFNIYYGVNVYSKESFGIYNVPDQSITITFNLNPSLFKYGLQRL